VEAEAAVLQTTPNHASTWLFLADAGNFGAYLGSRASAPPNPYVGLLPASTVSSGPRPSAKRASSRSGLGSAVAVLYFPLG